MTVSDRSIIFLVSALLASATLGTAGIIEQNNVFRNQIFEYRAQQLANDIDAMMYSDEGKLQKELVSVTDLTISSSEGTKQLTVDRNQIDSVTVDLDSNPDSKTITDAKAICVEKNPSNAFQSAQDLINVENESC